MEERVQQLKSLGLGEHEALVYDTLLASSPASATFIGKKCDLSRSSVYTTISVLVSKGLVGTTYKNDVKQFIALDYNSLEQLVRKERASAEHKLQLVQKLKETFTSLGGNDAHVPEIIFFEGQEGLKKIYLSMMRQASKQETLYLLRDEFVWLPEWEFIFDQDWHSRIKRWKAEKDIRTKLLINPSALEKSKSKFYRGKKGLDVRYLPEKNKVEKFATYMLGDTIAILSMEQNNLVGIKIINSHLAKNFIRVFDALWGKK